MSIFNRGRPGADPAAPGWWRGLSESKASASSVSAPQDFATTPGAADAPWWRRGLTPSTAAQDGRAPYDQSAYEQNAYDTGVSDEARVASKRTRRRGHPILAAVAILMLLVLTAAAGGVAFLGLAFHAGSFAAAGAAVDGQISGWRSGIVGGAANAAAEGGDALTSAGQSIKTRAQQAAKNGG